MERLVEPVGSPVGSASRAPAAARCGESCCERAEVTGSAPRRDPGYAGQGGSVIGLTFRRCHNPWGFGYLGG
jgi:hypothetical protein